MKIGLFTDGLAHLSFEAALDTAARLGIQMVEIGTGNFSPAPHCDLDQLLESSGARDQFLGTLVERGLALSALNCSGNLLHPDQAVGERSREVFRKTVLLA